MKLSLVLPCYNEGPGLVQLVQRVADALNGSSVPLSEFQLVLVENGSKDNSLTLMREIAAKPGREFVTIVEVPVNRGYGYGLWQGLKAAQGELIAMSHADLQCDPHDVFRALELYDREQKTRPLLVKGRRRGRAFSTSIISRVFEILALLILQRWMPEINAQPKLFDRSLLGNLGHPPLDFKFDLYLLLRARESGYHFRSIEVQFPPRQHGQSNWAASFRSKWRTIAGFIRYMADYRLGRGKGAL